MSFFSWGDAGRDPKKKEGTKVSQNEKWLMALEISNTKWGYKG
jgi:hypothetical protein